MCPPGPVFSQTRKITPETSASVRLACSLPTGLATVWLHKPPSVGKQAKKLGLFFLETGPAPGHVQNIPLATVHPGKSRNGDPLRKSWNPTTFFRNYKEWGYQGIPLLSLSFIYRFAVLALPAGQESMLQSKLGCGKVVLIPFFSQTSGCFET